MKKYTWLLGLTVAVVSCGSPGEDAMSPAAHSHDSTQAAAPPHHAEAGKLTLDDGKRWEANEATTAGIQNMKTLVAQFSGSADAGDCGNLHAQMEAEFNGILKKCTMKGKAHDQLHEYLVPMKSLIDQLASQDVSVCREAAQSLGGYLDQYETYFR